MVPAVKRSEGERAGLFIQPLLNPPNPRRGESDETRMGATSDQSPRIALDSTTGPDVQEFVRESLNSFRGELDAKAPG